MPNNRDLGTHPCSCPDARFVQKYVYEATSEVDAGLTKSTVVTKSTVPVGTSDEVERMLTQLSLTEDVLAEYTRPHDPARLVCVDEASK